MAQAFSVFAFVVIGAAIAAVLWWYVMTIYDAVFAQKREYVLGEVEIVGAANQAETYKKVLPRVIVAKLTNIRNETNDAIQALKEARDRRAGEKHFQLQEFVREQDLPQPFSKPLDVSLKIADVDVGPILSMFMDRSLFSEALEVTTSISGDGDSANVYGHLPGPQGYSFTETTTASIDHIADAVATAVVAEVVKREEPTLSALGAESYKNILSVLTDYAKHRRVAPILGSADRADLEALSKRLREPAHKFSRWRDLQWLAAEIAEEAEQWEDTNLYYANLDEITPDDHPDQKLIVRKIQSTEARLKEIQIARNEATRRRVDPKDVLAERATSRIASASNPVRDDLAKPIRELLGLTEPQDARGQTIAIVGVPWPEALEGLDQEVLGAMPQRANAPIRDYITELTQAIRLVAKDPRFLFVPIFGEMQQATLADALGRIQQRDDVNVVLFPYGSAQPSKITDNAIRELSAKVAIVVPAGNQPSDSSYSDVDDEALIIGAVTKDGDKALFTSRSDNMAWAPGVDIPIISPGSGATERRSGTAFSSALAAAAVVVLTKRFPDATRTALYSAIREGSKPAKERSFPPIINVPGAIDILEKSRATPASNPS